MFGIEMLQQPPRAFDGVDQLMAGRAGLAGAVTLQAVFAILQSLMLKGIRGQSRSLPWAPRNSGLVLWWMGSWRDQW